MLKPRTLELRETSIRSQTMFQFPMKQGIWFLGYWQVIQQQDQLSTKSVCIHSWQTAKFQNSYLSLCWLVHHLVSTFASSCHKEAWAINQRVLVLVVSSKQLQLISSDPAHQDLIVDKDRWLKATPLFTQIDKVFTVGRVKIPRATRCLRLRTRGKCSRNSQRQQYRRLPR